jgi:hypothetical protein
LLQAFKGEKTHAFKKKKKLPEMQVSYQGSLGMFETQKWTEQENQDRGRLWL